MADPKAELDPTYSAPGASPTPWSEARRVLEEARVYWLATVRPDGRPHVTTIAGILLDDTLLFATSAPEVKAANLARNAHAIITAGASVMTGLDVVVEGVAERVHDESTLLAAAEAYRVRYDDLFLYVVQGTELRQADADEIVLLFRLRPVKAFGFRKGGHDFSQTRWRFGQP
jgi:hypothetical protein